MPQILCMLIKLILKKTTKRHSGKVAILRDQETQGIERILKSKFAFCNWYFLKCVIFPPENLK